MASHCLQSQLSSLSLCVILGKKASSNERHSEAANNWISDEVFKAYRNTWGLQKVFNKSMEIQEEEGELLKLCVAIHEFTYSDDFKGQGYYIFDAHFLHVSSSTLITFQWL